MSVSIIGTPTNADRDLTSQVTVLTETPDVSNYTRCQAVIKLGDGSKDLDGSGGNFELTITIGGQTLQPDPETIVFSSAVRSVIVTSDLLVPANDEVVIKILSPNGADTDVDVTAYLCEISFGTDSAALAATALSNVTWTDAKAGYLDQALSTTETNIITEVDANETKIDALPTATQIQAEMEENGASILDTLRDDLADGGRLDLLIDAIKTKTDNLPSGITKNSALNNFEFLMVKSDHVTPAIEKTVTGTISKDGGAFSALTNAVSEVANGIYKVSMTATEMNANIVTLRFVASLCDDRFITITTSP